MAQLGRGRGRGNGARFFLPDVADWRSARRAERHASQDPDSITGIRLRRAAAQAEMGEIRLEKLTMQFLTVDQATRAKRAAFERVKKILWEFLPKHARASIGVTEMSVAIHRHEEIVQEALIRLSSAQDVPDDQSAEIRADSGSPSLMAIDGGLASQPHKTTR